MAKPQRFIHTPSGQRGLVVAEFNGGTVLDFQADTGARFTARQDELLELTDPVSVIRAQEARARAAAAHAQARRVTFEPDSGRTLYLLEVPPRRPRAVRQISRAEVSHV